ncbi:MAG: type II secretion system F family protein [Deltaproteobacteria bacterium]|nr:type II secretion system F family protein [Deltaproteobacteria bacterium]
MMFRIKADHMNMFYRQMAAMTASGMTVAEAVSTIAEEGDSSRMGKLISLMNWEISEGKPAGEVLIQHLDYLTNIPPELFKEDKEKIAPLFDRFAEYGERKSKIRNYAKTVMIYPAFILTVAAFVASGLLLFVIPIFEKMFIDMGGTLPYPTLVIINLSHFLLQYFVVLLVLLAMTILFFNKKKAFFYRIADKVPFLGKMNRKIAVAQFLSNLHLLFGFHLSAQQTCRAAAGNVNNDYIAKKLKEAGEKVSDYSDLLLQLERSGFFPGLIIKTLKVGNRAKALEAALNRSASFCEADAEKASDRFTAAMIPLTIIVVGTALGFFIIAMYLPIFSMAGSI